MDKEIKKASVESGMGSGKERVNRCKKTKKLIWSIIGMCLCVGSIVVTGILICKAFNLYKSFSENAYALGAFITLLIFTALMAVLFSVLSFKIYKASRDKEIRDDEKLREFVMAAFTYAMNGGDAKLKDGIQNTIDLAIVELTGIDEEKLKQKKMQQCSDEGKIEPTDTK
ncbi:MAG: hypothetical protein LBL66_09190 [Clostridiales bacterium]|jgi:uncharacterized membrane protein|nr:hypothetical protein [Clostridiales bacterium]